MFQFTLPHGERQTSGRYQTGVCCFNSRSRMGSDRLQRRRRPVSRPFQFTLPHGERRDEHLGGEVGDVVSIHAPAWGATRAHGQPSRSSPVSIHAPAWGATRRRFYPRAVLRVSIHAPAWGATGFDRDTTHYRSVSIHAPAWGATPPRSPISPRLLFQFTLPHGERPA